MVEKNFELKFNYDIDLEKPSEEKLKWLTNQVNLLSKIKQPEQKSNLWLQMRNDMITASDWAAAIGKNPYSTRNKLIRGKCGEKQFFFGKHMQHGVKYESVANAIYEYRNKVEVIEFGLLPHPKYNFLGASPDGITKNGIMLEIKCPPKRVITGEPPLYYWIQVQGQLEVCDLDRCDFLECKIEEYALDIDYFNDNYNNNYFFNGVGYEKGITLIFMDKRNNNLIYKHSKLGINNEDFNIWFDDTLNCVLENKNLIYVETTYWKLLEISCVPIYRDKEWFSENFSLLKEFWDDVLYYRDIGIDSLIKKNSKTKNNTNNKINIKIDTNIDDYYENKSTTTVTNNLKKCLFRNTKSNFTNIKHKQNFNTNTNNNYKSESNNESNNESKNESNNESNNKSTNNIANDSIAQNNFDIELEKLSEIFSKKCLFKNNSSINLPADKSLDKLVNKSVDKSVNKLVDKSVDKSIDKSVDKIKIINIDVEVLPEKFSKKCLFSSRKKK